MAAAPPPSWSSIPQKGELAIICSVRIVDFFQQAALQAVMFYQLASFSPDATESDTSFQVGVLQGVFTAAQIVTSIIWGRVADNPSWGRKRVILASLIGQALSCIGVAFSRTFTAAIVWRLLGGAVNATVSGARTALAEKTGKKYHSRTFLLLPLAWNIANILGPPVGGILSDLVKYHPDLFGDNSTFGGRNGVGWMRKFPYAAPNLFCALLLFADATLVLLGLEETLAARRGKRDRGIELARLVCEQMSLKLLKRRGYSRLGQNDGFNVADEEDDLFLPSSTPMDEVPENDTQTSAPSMHTAAAAMRTAPVAAPLRNAFTPNVFLVLLTTALLDFQLAGFTSLWTMFLSTERRSATDPSIHPPLSFTGGLGFAPSTIGVAMSILGFAGIVCQLTLYPPINARLGLLRSTKYSLLIFPIAYLIAPYLSLLADLSSFLVWSGIILVAFIVIFARTFAVPGSVLLVNNCSPAPELLGTIHGMGAATSSAFRTIGPIVAGHWYGKGLQCARIGEAWWLLALSALAGCLPVFWVKNGK